MNKPLELWVKHEKKRENQRKKNWANIHSLPIFSSWYGCSSWASQHFWFVCLSISNSSKWINGCTSSILPCWFSGRWSSYRSVNGHTSCIARSPCTLQSWKSNYRIDNFQKKRETGKSFLFFFVKMKYLVNISSFYLL